MEPTLQIQGDGPAVSLPARSALIVPRLPALLLFAPALTLLLVAASLKPDLDGVGTHSQLGLPPCGFLLEHGIPCTTCGMTTSFALMADGRLIDAFITQPAGAALAMLTAMLVLLSGWSLVTAAPLKPVFEGVWRPRTVVWLGALVLGAWGYKIFTYHGTH